VLIAVTGASGFVGGRVTGWLTAAGHRVLPYGRRPAHALDGYTAWDLRAGPIPAPRVDAVVHCAAAVSDWGSEREFRAVNVGGTRAVLATFPDALIVHVSTASVYGSGVFGRGLREDDPPPARHLNGYARTKLEAEREVADSGRPAVVLRPHVVYGPGDTTLLPRLLAARRFGRLLVPGDGRNRISITHVDNFCRAVALALDWRGAGAEVCNVADEEPASVDELLRSLLTALGLPVRITYVPRAAAWPLAALLEAAWAAARAGRAPLLTRYLVAQISEDRVLDIGRARAVLRYRPARHHREAFAELAGAAP
jgi:nucleoside-diphosphate-sugar epimerase